MIVRYSLSWKIFVFFLAFLLSSCALLKKERTFSKNGLKVTFRSLNALDDIQSIKFRYPIVLTERQLQNHLLSLWYQNIVSPGKPKPLFSKEDVKMLAPLFRTALKKVEPRKYLHFEFQSSGGFIEGQVFVTDQKIHWRFLKINNKVYSDDPLRIRKPTWKLVRMHGQTYQIQQTGGFKKYFKNRIIANIDLPFPKQRSQAGSATKKHSQSSIENTELKKKLGILQKLLDEGLIDKSEYDKKKEAVLNKHLNIHE